MQLILAVFNSQPELSTWIILKIKKGLLMEGGTHSSLLFLTEVLGKKDDINWKKKTNIIRNHSDKMIWNCTKQKLSFQVTEDLWPQ